MREKDLIDFASGALLPGFAVHSIHIRETASGYHFEIELDGINDPRGAVNIRDCEEYSRRFVDLLDRAILEEGVRNILPDDLTPENYSLEVSSCGVERRLTIPEDLERFRELPLKIKFLKDDKKITEIALYVECRRENDKINYIFDRYAPTRRKKKGGGDKNKKDLSGSVSDKRFSLSPEELLQANLYLDF
jgi:ribosome maturation factor RimP